MQTFECSREVLSLIATHPSISLRDRVRLAALLNEQTRCDLDQICAALSLGPGELRRLASWQSIPELCDRVRETIPGLVTIVDPLYPERLRQTAAPPLALHCHGRTELLSAPAVAVVGSRRASSYGANVARRFASALARGGLAVVSGFARGIDAIAHASALDAGGATIAVLGTGLGIDYPAGQAALRARIRTEGLVISEFPDPTPPRPANFPIRNRIISGLVHGVLVIEAGLRSGSLVTARLALEQNREVWAVPGPVLSDSSAGCHALIQQGARLVTSADEILEDLGLSSPHTSHDSGVPSDLSLDAKTLWERLPADHALHLDILAGHLGWAPPRLAAALLDLELAGGLQREPGGGVLRCVR